MAAVWTLRALRYDPNKYRGRYMQVQKYKRGIALTSIDSNNMRFAECSRSLGSAKRSLGHKGRCIISIYIYIFPVSSHHPLYCFFTVAISLGPSWVSFSSWEGFAPPSCLLKLLCDRNRLVNIDHLTSLPAKLPEKNAKAGFEMV